MALLIPHAASPAAILPTLSRFQGVVNMVLKLGKGFGIDGRGGWDARWARIARRVSQVRSGYHARQSLGLLRDAHATRRVSAG
jgi:hypothetical protein